MQVVVRARQGDGWARNLLAIITTVDADGGVHLNALVEAASPGDAACGAACLDYRGVVLIRGAKQELSATATPDEGEKVRHELCLKLIQILSVSKIKYDQWATVDMGVAMAFLKTVVGAVNGLQFLEDQEVLHHIPAVGLLTVDEWRAMSSPSQYPLEKLP